MPMRAPFEGIRLIVCAWAFLIAIVLGMPVRAEQLSPDGAPNPDASVVNQQTLLQQGPRVEGRITIPDARAAVLIQPAGRRWTYFHEVTLHWLATIVIPAQSWP
jgi:formate dehydrogenase subunit gamma